MGSWNSRRARVGGALAAGRVVVPRAVARAPNSRRSGGSRMPRVVDRAAGPRSDVVAWLVILVSTAGPSLVCKPALPMVRGRLPCRGRYPTPNTNRNCGGRPRPTRRSDTGAPVKCCCSFLRVLHARRAGAGCLCVFLRTRRFPSPYRQIPLRPLFYSERSYTPGSGLLGGAAGRIYMVGVAKGQTKTPLHIVGQLAMG